MNEWTNERTNEWMEWSILYYIHESRGSRPGFILWQSFMFRLYGAHSLVRMRAIIPLLMELELGMFSSKKSLWFLLFHTACPKLRTCLMYKCVVHVRWAYVILVHVLFVYSLSVIISKPSTVAVTDDSQSAKDIDLHFKSKHCGGPHRWKPVHILSNGLSKLWASNPIVDSITTRSTVSIFNTAKPLLFSWTPLRAVFDLWTFKQHFICKNCHPQKKVTKPLTLKIVSGGSGLKQTWKILHNAWSPHSFGALNDKQVEYQATEKNFAAFFALWCTVIFHYFY